MIDMFKNFVNSCLDFIDFLNHVSFSQWDIEQPKRQRKEHEAYMQQQE